MDADDRRVVKTYLPAEQKQQWKAHADDLDMSQSEFVRTMVQAGRRGFDDVTTDLEDPDSSETTPEGNDLKTPIIDALDDGAKPFDDILAAVTADIEARVDETLQELQEAGRVRYSGRAGGFMLTDD